MASNQFYFTKQDNFVNKNIYANSHDLEDHYTDDDGYWPLMKQSDMVFSGPIDNTLRNSDLVLLNELMYQVDTVEMDDSYLQLGFTHREKDFLNLKS